MAVSYKKFMACISRSLRSYVLFYRLVFSHNFLLKLNTTPDRRNIYLRSLIIENQQTLEEIFMSKRELT